METTDFAAQREDLLQSIERDQEEVRVAVQELTGAVRSTLKVSEHIKRFPMTWAIGAFFVGIWLGSRAGVRVATALVARELGGRVSQTGSTTTHNTASLGHFGNRKRSTHAD